MNPIKKRFDQTLGRKIHGIPQQPHAPVPPPVHAADSDPPPVLPPDTETDPPPVLPPDTEPKEGEGNQGQQGGQGG